MERRRLGDPIRRTGYRLANMVIGTDRRVRRSRGRGVKFIACDERSRVLLVRHTYGNRHWTLPGGRVRRSEPADSAAVRELSEELSLSDPDLTELGSYPARMHRRSEAVTVFMVNCHGPDLIPNPVELAELGWFDRGDLPDELDPAVETALGLLDGHHAEAAAGGGIRSA